VTEGRIRLRAIALLRDHLGVKQEITDATTLDQLNADSLDRIEAGMALEEEFGLTIPDEAIQKWSTVGDVLDWLARRQSQPKGS
jgi:acyl carrier protein